MGHWRLMYPFSYGRSLGYKYLLQVDKDSHFHEVIKHNLVEVMADGKFDMGARHTGRDEPTWGLPEITKYFLVAEQIQPATLFDHCSPNNIDGLHTVSSRTFSNPEGSDDPLKLIRAEDTRGWDQETVSSNFVLYDLDLWFREDVQSYLALVLSTGGHFRFRWNEQGVVSMIWQIFVQKNRFKRFSFKYSHG